MKIILPIKICILFKTIITFFIVLCNNASFKFKQDISNSTLASRHQKAEERERTTWCENPPRPNLCVHTPRPITVTMATIRDYAPSQHCMAVRPGCKPPRISVTPPHTHTHSHTCTQKEKRWKNCLTLNRLYKLPRSRVLLSCCLTHGAKLILLFVHGAAKKAPENHYLREKADWKPKRSELIL